MALSPQADPTGSAAQAEPSRPTALVLRALGLGDLLTGVPALRGVRAALPQHRLLLAAPARWRALVELFGCIDDLLPTDGLHASWPADQALPQDVRGEVDVAVNLHGSGPQSHRLLQRLNARDLVAFACPPIAPPGPRTPPWRADEHEVRRWCRLVDTAFVPVCDPADLLIARPAVPAVASGAYAVVHPGAAFASRRWPAGRFVQVAAALRSAGLDVLVTAGADEAELGASVAEAAGAGALIGADVRQLCAAVADASLVVCGDTGIAHLATAYGRPSVVLFGPIAPALWGPPVDGPHTVLWHGDGTGDPHGRDVDPALLSIEAQEVIEACLRRLGIM